MKASTQYAIGILGLVMSGATWASSVTLPNTFTANTPAKATQVNANFTALVAAINTLESTVAAQANTISTLQTKVTNQTSTINTLQSQLTSMQDSQVMALNPYLSVDTTSDPRGPLVTLSGVNLQVVNGMGATETSNGLGNIIIGYDEADTSGVYRCSIGFDLNTRTAVTTQSTCSAIGGTWTNSGFKTGSHYLIVGGQNNYSAYGGIVVGYRNTSNTGSADVLGGEYNTASGPYSAVSGGSVNTASGMYSSVSGGYRNTANHDDSSVSGGLYNTAGGQFSNVSGGAGNTASGNGSSVNGGGGLATGAGNTAADSYSSILGGSGQTLNSSSADTHYP